MSSAAVKDNKAVQEENDEVKKLLNVKGNTSLETCPHRKTPVSQDIGTLHYDCKSNLGFLSLRDYLLIFIFIVSMIRRILAPKISHLS